MSRGTAGVPEGVLLESNGISRDLTPSGLKTPAAPALKGRRSHEICQGLTNSRRDHNPRVGGSSPSSATNFLLCYQRVTSAEPLAIFLASRSGGSFWVPDRSVRARLGPIGTSFDILELNRPVVSATAQCVACREGDGPCAAIENRCFGKRQLRAHTG